MIRITITTLTRVLYRIGSLEMLFVNQVIEKEVLYRIGSLEH